MRFVIQSTKENDEETDVTGIEIIDLIKCLTCPNNQSPFHPNNNKKRFSINRCQKKTIAE